MKKVYVLVVVLTTLSFCTIRSLAASPIAASIQPVSRAAVNHMPVILRVVDREEIRGGSVYLHKDIYFTDAAGDAVTVVNTLITSSLPFRANVSDDVIRASAVDQKGEALVTSTWGCGMKATMTFEDRILDKAGNLSEPVLVNFACKAPPVETQPYLTIGLIGGLILGLGLLAGFWLLFRSRPSERLPALQSALLLCCLIFLLKFMQMILHEGGHSLYLWIQKVPITLYVHPFDFSGFYRPMIDFSIWSHILGSAVAIPVSLLISLLFWKSRSWITLPFRMLFPWVALNDGMYIMTVQGDFGT